jgi:transcriptional regulator with XRE-family HTH domain
MPKVPLSSLTSRDVLAINAALRLTRKQFAGYLGVSQTLISNIINNGWPVTARLAADMRGLLDEHLAEIGIQQAAISQHGNEAALLDHTIELVKAHSPRRKPEYNRKRLKIRTPSAIAGHMCVKVEQLDRPVPGAFRLKYSEVGLFITALAKYRKHITEQAALDPEYQGWHLELADVKHMANEMRGVLARGTPYDVWFLVGQKPVMWRVLKHEYDAPVGDRHALALAMRWRNVWMWGNVRRDKLTTGCKKEGERSRQRMVVWP